MSSARTLTITGLSIVAAISASVTNAQTSGFYQPTAPYPVEMGYYQHHSSTAYEGGMRGRAAVIQALGNYRLLDSQAKILDEQAESLSYDNDLKKTETLYQKKYLWQQHRDSERARRLARDAAGKQMLAEREANYYREVYRLTSQEFDRSTGRLSWPEAISSEELAQTRRQLSFLFRQRARYAGADNDPFAERILQLSEELKQGLKDQIADMDPSSYSEAQNFVRGLMYEVRFSGEEDANQIG